MLQDPEKRIHIVTEGVILGREKATVSRILNREVIVTERTTNYLGVESLFERVLSLPPDKDLDDGAQAADSSRRAEKQGSSGDSESVKASAPPSAEVKASAPTGSASSGPAPAATASSSAKGAPESTVIRGKQTDGLVY